MIRSKFIRSSYAVCTNPRSGSWLLCDGLASTSIAGNPREWFNSAEERNQRSQWSIGYSLKPVYSAYLDHVLEHATSPNGILGIKLHYYQFAELPAKFASIKEYQSLGASQLLPALFPNIKYIWLTRRNKARQAISYYRACKTKEWWVLDEAGPKKQQESALQMAFDPQTIGRLENILVQNELNWQRHFEAIDIAPLQVFYEDLVDDFAGNLVKILNWLDVPGAEAICIPAPRLKRQADAQTEEWLASYSSFKAKQDYSVSVPVPEPTSPPPVGPPGKDGRALESNLLESPLFILSRTTASTISDSWKRWIGENRLLRVPDESIVEVLTRNGYPREIAVAEVANAACNPYLLAGQLVQQRLNKALSLFNVFHALAGLHPKAHEVERRTNVSRSDFLENYYSANRPVILQGLMTDWPAMTRWTPEYLKSAAGHEQIEIMARRDRDRAFELNADQHRLMMQFGDYVDMVYGGEVTNDYYLVANNKFFQRSAGRALLADLKIFTEYLDPATVDNQVFLWFGPGGTVTPLHHDTSNILMAQVAGRKHIKLIAASHWPHIYNEVGVFSRVDCENPDFDRWPEFRDATVLDVTLESGEVLFMPVGWWHQVRSPNVSIMVSFTNFAFPNHYEWLLQQTGR